MAVDYHAEAVKRRLAEAEIERAAAEAEAARVAAQNRARQRTRIAINAALLLVLAGAAAFGVRSWQTRRAERRRAAELQRAEQDARMRAEQAAAEAEAAKARDAAAARKRAWEEKQRAQRAEQEARRAEQARQREEQNKRLAEERAAAEAQRLARETRRKTWDAADKSLYRVPVRLWRDFPKEKRPGACDGVFNCLLPDGVEAALYRVTSAADGTLAVARLMRESADEPMESAAYAAAVAARGCLCECGGTVYLALPSAASAGQETAVPQGSLHPSLALLGEQVCNLIDGRGLRADALAFDVTYLPPRGGAAVPVRRVSYAQSVGRQEILDAVLQNALKKWRPPKAKAARQTVVFYDGNAVKRGANGVTYVPRAPTGRTGATYAKLAAEAERQEQAQNATAGAADAAKDRFMRKIEDGLDDGRIKITLAPR